MFIRFILLFFFVSFYIYIRLSKREIYFRFDFIIIYVRIIIIIAFIIHVLNIYFNIIYNWQLVNYNSSIYFTIFFFLVEYHIEEIKVSLLLSFF